MNLLSTRSLEVAIGGHSICSGLDLELRSGQRWGILGCNGVGKTTLLQTLAGLQPAVHGTIAVEGVDLHRWKRRELARKLGVLFQDSQDTFPGTVLETALAGRHPYLPFWSVEGKSDFEYTRQALEQVAMADKESRQVNTLSGGERRRLAIATLLVQDPLIWLLDEPTNHLDLHHQITLLQLIIDRVAAIDGGLMMVLHDVNLIIRFCSHVMLMLDHGGILCGPVEVIVTRENLERLYRHPIREVPADGVSFFLPE